MGLLDFNPPESTVLPEDYDPGLLDYIWYDESDRRYCLTGPNACSEEQYYTTVDHKQFMSDLESNPNAAAPPGYDSMIEQEDREIARIRKEKGWT